MQKILAPLTLSLLMSLFFLILPSWAGSPVAVIDSDKNEAAFFDQHLGKYDDAWQSFKQTMNATNVAYDILSDQDLIAGSTRLKDYKIIFVPVMVDLPPGAVELLTDFVRNGGKLIVTDGGGVLGPNAQAIAQLTGVSVARHLTTTEETQLGWPPVTQDFPIGTLYASVAPTAQANVLANWQSKNGTVFGAAAIKCANGIYLGWAPGLQGEISTNATLLSGAMDDLSPGITQQAAVQISFADYQNIQQELDYLAKRTEEVIKTAKQADLAVPFKVIQENFDSATAHVKAFQDAYHNRAYFLANDELAKARHDFSMAFAQAMPVRRVEARAIWLDRGTIVSLHNQAGVSKLFDKLKLAGINTVYFECNNAGYAIFPSTVAVQNPGTLGWDPLAAAVKEAHMRDMELHAWCWIFAVGNIRHNPIVGKEPDYPGPVLSSHDISWALASSDGSLLPYGQPEFWIDPANLAGRQYIKDLIVEIVQKYPVDGVQLDYIRYPFNNRGREMGFDWVGRTRFESQTGLSLDKLTDETRRVWLAWKIQQVNDFVCDVSTTLRKLKPTIRISAAVYAMPRRMRINAIQQEWETWVKNGWIDTLNPMTYVASASDLANAAGYVRESTEDKALCYPGLSIRQLDTAGLVEQLDTSRAIGTLGTTMFAMAQLDDKKQELLHIGPYRKPCVLTPQSHPLKAVCMLMDDFAAMVNRYMEDPKKHILSDQLSTNEVILQINQVQHDLHVLTDNSTSDELNNAGKEVVSLHNLIKEWLRLEAFAQRGFRAQYIANYLGQVEAILSYAAQHAKMQSAVVAGSVN